MEVRKRLTVMAEVGPPRQHRYPTRWKLRHHASHSSLSSRPQDKAIVTQLAPSKRNKRLKCTLYLPSEIIFNILLFLPAKVLHQVVRCVCKQWNDIVNDPHFIKAHCQSSTAGLLVQNPVDPRPVYYIEGDYITTFAFPSHTRIYGSFNGLVLFHDLKNPQILSVINPVIRVKMSLPPVDRLNPLGSSIGYAITSTGHYKVVVSLRVEGHSPKIHVMVFTIGIDKAWRFIDLQGNSEMKRMAKVLPRFIAGMLYFCHVEDPCYAIDVDTETIYLFHRPNEELAGQMVRGRFITLGACLGIAQIRDSGSWNLWKLTDVKSGKWTKLAGINISLALSTVSKELYPKTYNSYMPIMLIDNIFWFYHVFQTEYLVIRLNLANGSFVFFPVKCFCYFTAPFHHVHTLLSPKQCYP